MHPQHTQWVLAVTKQREVPALPILDLKARRELRYADTRSAPLEHNKVLAYRSEAGHQYEVPARHAACDRDGLACKPLRARQGGHGFLLGQGDLNLQGGPRALARARAPAELALTRLDQDTERAL